MGERPAPGAEPGGASSRTWRRSIPGGQGDRREGQDGDRIPMLVGEGQEYGEVSRAGGGGEGAAAEPIADRLFRLDLDPGGIVDLRFAPSRGGIQDGQGGGGPDVAADHRVQLVNLVGGDDR